MTTCRPSLSAGLVLLLFYSLAASAQTLQAPARTYRIGYIQTATLEEQAHLTKAFEDGLRELGYVEVIPGHASREDHIARCSKPPSCRLSVP